MLPKAVWRMKVRIADKARLYRDAWFGPLPCPERWVFVVGCTNSGTTLLHDTIAQHPDVGKMPEDGHFLTDRLVAPWDVGLRRVWGTRPELFRLTESDGGARRAMRLKRQWGARFDDPFKPVLLEKTPPNALRMRWLERHFEDPHFIGIVRHPFAVTEGIRRKTDRPIELAARQWRMTNEQMLEDSEHIEHFMVVRYEDLTERGDEVIRRVAEFIRLDAEPISTDRTWRPIGGVDRKIRNHNERSFEALSAAEKELVAEQAGPLMERFGYTMEAPEAPTSRALGS